MVDFSVRRRNPHTKRIAKKRLGRWREYLRHLELQNAGWDQRWIMIARYPGLYEWICEKGHYTERNEQ